MSSNSPKHRFTPGFGWLAVVLVTAFILVGVACGPSNSPAVPTEPVTPTVAPQPSPTELPLLAPTATVAPTATTATEAATSTIVSDQCQFEFFFEPTPDSCPAGLPVVSAAAEQPFEGGVMNWLEVSDSIVVFFDDGRWQRFEDTWSEDQPERDPSLTPPSERFQPIRGFGKVWRQQPEVRESLGWALGVELAYEATVQDQSSISGQPHITYLQTYNGQILALIHRAPDEGDWVIAADNR